MSDTPMNVCWLDLETTGTDEDTGSIVEIGCVMTDPDLREVESLSLLVKPDEDHWLGMNYVVVRMHRTSGLFDAVNDGYEDLDRFDALSHAEADRLLVAFLDRHAVSGRVILAGSEVSHFDHRWIRRHLPRSSRKLTWWAWDVGNVRRFLGSIDPALVRPPSGPKAHRGTVDARDHLDEWRFYRSLIREGMTGLHVAAARPRPLVDVLAPEAVEED